MLVTIEDENVQLQLYQEIVRKQLSVREVERRVRALHQAKPAQQTGTTVPETQEPALQELINQLRTHFSTQVNIRHRADGSGKIELNYYSPEDLERLLNLLLNSPDEGF